MSGLAYGPHASRPVAGLASGDLYLCTTHRLVYQTVNGGRDWASWGDLMGGDGGGVSVDPGTGTPVAVTDFVIPGASIVGAIATLVATTLLGPYPVAFDDYLGSGGNFPIDLADLAAGTIVVDAWAEISTAFDALTLSVVIGPAADLTNSDDLVAYDPTVANIGGGGAYSVERQFFGSGTPNHVVGRAITPCKLGTYLAWSGPFPTTGAANIYALIASPAS